MTVGFYSPMPPARTGVADYAAALLAELVRHGRVEAAPERCDVALYQMGNNPLHADVYRRLLRRPGVVTLHDAVLHHFFLGQLDRAAYIEEFLFNYGEWNRGLAEELWRGRACSGTDSRYFDYPMLKRVAERALAVVTHNAAAARMVREASPEARVVEIPHLLQEVVPAQESEISRYRSKLGVDPRSFLFGVFGYLRESKRLFPVLRVFEEIHREIPSTALLVAGQFVSTDLERSIQPLLAQPGVIRRPYLEEGEFWQAASAVDACINLRDPAAGESSGIAIRMMGLGKPVLMTDGEEVAAFPEGSCVRIPAGPAEREALRQYMTLLPSRTEVARAIGQRGSAHVLSHHRVEQIGKQYWDLLCGFVS